MVEFLIDLGQSPLSVTLATSPWVVPTMQSIHILSIAIIFSSILVIALRVLGVIWLDQSILKAVQRFAPWAWGALATLVVTGIILVTAEPFRELMALSFWLKMLLLLIAVVISVRFLRAVRSNPSYAEAATQADTSTQRMTIATLAIWVAIIFLGRLIAYDTLIWGQLSPLWSV